jgi:ABC-type multidrug transport system fused ATPase/permease subunit
MFDTGRMSASTQQQSPAKGKPTRMKRIMLRRLRKLRGQIAVAALCMLGFTAAELLAPWPLKLIFDHVLLDRPLDPGFAFLQGILQQGNAHAVLMISLGIVAIAGLRAVFAFGQVYLTSRMGFELVYTLRRKLFMHLQRLSLSFHNRARTGELINKLTSDTNVLRDVLGDSALNFVAHSLTLIGMLAIMLAINWQLSLVVMLTLPALSLALFHLFRRIKTSVRQRRKSEAANISRVAESLSAMALVKTFAREDHERERFTQEGLKSLQTSIRGARLEAVATRTVELVSALGTWAVVLLGSLQALKGTMTPGEVLIFVNYVTTMYRPIRNMAKLSSKFSRAAVSMERLGEIFATDPEIRDRPDAVEAPHFRGEFEFDRVQFAYSEGGRLVLDGVSFSVAAGQRVALLGPSGSGKSTIANLILRLYEPSAGQVRIDGRDIHEFRIDSLREQIAVVMQGAVLFGASVGENIAYGKPDATQAEIEAAAKAANAHDFIIAMPHGYDTVVGERGATLSGGQRQRLAIARALIRDASILILDEPMTGLDVDSEAQVREALERLMADRTCLVITHDLEGLEGMDRVLRLQERQIIDVGLATARPSPPRRIPLLLAR